MHFKILEILSLTVQISSISISDNVLISKWVSCGKIAFYPFLEGVDLLNVINYSDSILLIGQQYRRDFQKLA